MNDPSRPETIREEVNAEDAETKSLTFKIEPDGLEEPASSITYQKEDGATTIDFDASELTTPKGLDDTITLLDTTPADLREKLLSGDSLEDVLPRRQTHYESLTTRLKPVVNNQVILSHGDALSNAAAAFHGHSYHDVLDGLTSGEYYDAPRETTYQDTKITAAQRLKLSSFVFDEVASIAYAHKDVAILDHDVCQTYTSRTGVDAENVAATTNQAVKALRILGDQSSLVASNLKSAARRLTQAMPDRYEKQVQASYKDLIRTTHTQ